MSDMGSYYQCSDPDSNEKNWTGHIRPLNRNRNEFEVTARGSTFHLLVGKHEYGKYLCIPKLGDRHRNIVPAGLHKMPMTQNLADL